MKKSNLIFLVVLIGIFGMVSFAQAQCPDPDPPDSVCATYCPIRIDAADFLSADVDPSMSHLKMVDFCKGFWRSSDGGSTWERSVVHQAPYRMFRGAYFTDDMEGWIWGEVGEILYTSDAGDSWVLQEQGATKWWACLQTIDNNLFYVGGGDGAYAISGNGGSSWWSKEHDMSGDFTDVATTEHQNAWMTTSTGQVVYSDNTGESWTTQADIENGLNSLWVAADGMAAVAVGDGGAVLYSSDGMNWNEQTSGTTENLHAVWADSAHTLFCAVGENGTLITSTDGMNWGIPENLPTIDGPITDVYVGGQSIWFTTTNGSVHISSDGGETWMEYVVMEDLHLNSVWCNTDRRTGEWTRGIVCGNNGEAYLTYDGGDNWWDSFTPTGFERDFFEVRFFDNYRGWMTGENGTFFRTDNGGVEWKQMTVRSTSHMNSIAFSEIDVDSEVGHDVGWLCGDNGSVYYTTNSGRHNWIKPFPWEDPETDQTSDFYGISFLNENLGYMCSGYIGDPSKTGFIVKTTDGAENWETLMHDTVNDFLDCAFVSESEGWIVGGDETAQENTVIWHTTNGGETWDTQDHPDEAELLRAVDFVSPTEGWAVGMGATILHTTNAGQTWEVQNNFFPQILTDTTYVDTTFFNVDFADEENGLVCGWNRSMVGENEFDAFIGIWRTTNGGEEWFRYLQDDIDWKEYDELLTPAAQLGLKSYPNPFNPTTTIQYILPIGDRVSVKIYSVTGQLVKTLVSEYKEMGAYFIQWDGTDDQNQPLASGTYIINYEAAGQSVSQNITLLK